MYAVWHICVPSRLLLVAQWVDFILGICMDTDMRMNSDMDLARLPRYARKQAVQNMLVELYAAGKAIE